MEGNTQEETYASKAIDAVSNSNLRYDASVKCLLADKQILARIIKYTLDEFKEMEIDDIIAGIGADIEIADRAVDEGLSNYGRVRGNETEHYVLGEGKIVYDIRFTLYHKEQEYKVLVNIEAQKSTNPSKLGYHIRNRIIFYLARMISAQKEQEFFHSQYDDMKRVRSIWICLDGAEEEDSIEEIRLANELKFGKIALPECPDLMKGIIVRIRKREDITESKNILIAMLEDLFKQEQPEAKKRCLHNIYGIVMNQRIEGKVEEMCNWSEVVAENAEKRGIQRGMQQGMLDTLYSLVKDGLLKLSDAAQRAGMSEMIFEEKMKKAGY